jgi:uncharacterized protein YndB with AHSA1/START domain
MYGHSIPVTVRQIEHNETILIEWGPDGERTTVEWHFTPYENDKTYVTIANSGFGGNGDKIVASAIDSKGGFTWVLAGLKAYLEHGIELNVIADAYPRGLMEH